MPNPAESVRIAYARRLRLLSRIAAVTIAGALMTACFHRSPVTRHDTPIEPLSAPQLRLHDELSRDVRSLSVGIGPRHAAGSIEAILEAERWIIERLRSAGIEPQRDEIDLGGAVVANVVATLPGTRRSEEIVLIGAHYDTVIASPGADDNASGVALLLALAERLADAPLERTVRIVFFVNEEDPFTGGVQMGSRVHADRSRGRGDDIVLMISVDSVGFYAHEKGSQHYPPVVGALFPSRGDFVVFATNKQHRKMLDHVVSLYQKQSRFPVVGVATNSRQINRGDHAPFLWAGYPSIAVSDTSEFRNPNYHRSTDTIETLDLDAMARMAEGWIDLVLDLANQSRSEFP